MAGLLLLPKGLFLKYPEAAQLVHAGTLGAEQASDFSPLYLTLHVLAGATTVRWLQAALVAACLWAIFRWAQRWFGWQAGLAAVALAASSRSLLVLEATFEPEALQTTLLALGFSALAWVPGAVLPRRAAALGGLALGLASAARPTGLLFLAGAAFWLLVLQRRLVPARTGSVMLLGAVLGLAIPAATVRATLGAELKATMSVGQVFAIGNRPEVVGTGAQPSALIKFYEVQRPIDTPDSVHALYREAARAQSAEPLTPTGAELFWLQKGLAFATHEPFAFARMLLRKVPFLLLGPDLHDISAMKSADNRLARYPLLPAEAMGALGLAASAILLRRRGLGLLWLHLSSVAATCLGFYVISRYREAAVPGLAVVIAGAGCELWKSRRDVQRWATAVALVVAVFAGQALFPVLKSARGMTARAQVGGERFDAAKRLRAEGKGADARRAFAEALGAFPFLTTLGDLRGFPFDAPDVLQVAGRFSVERFGLDTDLDVYVAAELAARAGGCDAAVKALEGTSFTWALWDLTISSHLLAARCHFERGRASEARAEVEAALAQRPGALDPLAQAIVAAEAAGEADSAETRARRDELLALHDPYSAHAALGRAALEWKRPEAALAETTVVLTAFPKLGWVEYDRAAALLALGRNDEAFESLTRALAELPQATFDARPFAAALQSARAADPAVNPQREALEHQLSSRLQP